jgi:carboxylate-amine ligase
MSSVRKVGVEEELLLVHPETGELANAAGAVLHDQRTNPADGPPAWATQDLEGELLRDMIETHTDPTEDLAEIARQIRAARRTAITAAGDVGVAVAVTGTPPLGSTMPVVSAHPRYERIVQEFGDTGRGAGTFGMHVHVDIGDDEEGVRVIDGLRPWLPLLTALSANSPYASGRETGYASWRQQVWTRWPTAGTAEPYGSATEYRRVGETMMRLGAALDQGMLYYDARLSEAYPTVEIRVADACTDVDDGVLVAALARALVETLADGRRLADQPRSDLLRAAWWRAARYGLSGDLVHPVTWDLVPAGTALEALVEAVGPALEEAGDTALVAEGLARVATTGTGAQRQRQAFERTGELQGVVADLVRRTSEAAQDSTGRTP